MEPSNTPPQSPANKPDSPASEANVAASVSSPPSTPAPSKLPETPSPTTLSQTPATPNSTASPKPRKRHHKLWLTIFILVAIAVAVGGIIFGINQHNFAATTQTENESLKADLAAKDELIAKYGAKLGTSVSESNRPVTSSPEENKPVTLDTDTYIYIPEWRIKFKKPDGLKNLTYIYQDNTTGQSHSTDSDTIRYETVCFAGTPAEATNISTGSTWPAHAGSGTGCINRTNYDPVQGSSAPTIIKQDDDYYYSYSAPQSVLSENEQEQAWEISASMLIRDMIMRDLSAF